jgi:hypothetical protein
MLSCVQTALQGAEAYRGITPVTEIEKDAQDLVKGLLAQIDAALKIVNSPNVPEEQLDNAINTLGQEVAKLVPSGASPTPPPPATPPAAAAPASPSGPATASPRTTPPSQQTGTVGVKE